MAYRRTKRRKSFWQRLGGFFVNLGGAVSELFNRLAKGIARAFPKRKPGEPIYKSRRLWLAAGSVLVIAAVVVSVVLFAGSSGGKARSVQAESESIVEATPTPEPMNLVEGSRGEDVQKLHERLMELSYFESDEAADGYTEATTQAVKRFQIIKGIDPTGTVNDALWEELFAEDAPLCALTVSMEGDDIKELQSRLRELSYIDVEPTGFFGSDTADAVTLFQQKNDLTVSGMIDLETEEMLYSEDVAPNFLSYGEKSEAVADMQAQLITLGYLSGKADGVYGNRTLAAVKLFQKKNDLVVDGYLGYQTKQLLLSGNADANAFSIGDEGSEVERLQNRLVKLKYINKGTGYFGSDTDLAVKNFQKLNGLSVDGKAGPKTLAKLYSEDAVVAKSTIKVGQSSKVNKFIEAAASKLGHRYVGGGKGPNVFDCSGLVYWCLKQAGVNQSYVTSVTWRKVGNYKTIKDIGQVKKGDIICFSPHHVGIAISSSMMIDASSGNGKVVKRSFTTSYWKRAFVCARRVF